MSLVNIFVVNSTLQLQRGAFGAGLQNNYDLNMIDPNKRPQLVSGYIQHNCSAKFTSLMLSTYFRVKFDSGKQPGTDRIVTEFLAIVGAKVSCLAIVGAKVSIWAPELATLFL